MRTYKYLWRNWIIIFLSISITLLVGCGGSGGGGDSVSSVSGTISGTAIKGSVADATITAFSINVDGTKGKPIGTGQTDEQGNFSILVGNHSGSVLMEMTGGHYMDEATGKDMDVFQGDIMTCAMLFMTAGSTMSGIQITPLTSMAQNMARNMSGGMIDVNITDANNAIGRYFDVNDILHTQPMDPTIDGSGIGADQHMMNYGMTIAAMSQYAQMVGMPNSSGIVTNMMNDASDWIMNGMMGESQIMMGGGMMGGTMMPPNAGTSGLASAMMDFIQSQMNKSGVAVQEMDILINKLNTTSGIIQ